MQHRENRPGAIPGGGARHRLHPGRLRRRRPPLRPDRRHRRKPRPVPAPARAHAHRDRRPHRRRGRRQRDRHGPAVPRAGPVTVPAPAADHAHPPAARQRPRTGHRVPRGRHSHPEHRARPTHWTRSGRPCVSSQPGKHAGRSPSPSEPHRRPWYAPHPARIRSTTPPRRSRCSPAAALGRLPGAAVPRRVLAGIAGRSARPDPLPPGRQAAAGSSSGCRRNERNSRICAFGAARVTSGRRVR